MGNKGARDYIAMIKVVAPNMALRVIDRAVQAHGGAGTLRLLYQRICPNEEALAVWSKHSISR